MQKEVLDCLAGVVHSEIVEKKKKKKKKNFSIMADETKDVSKP